MVTGHPSVLPLVEFGTLGDIAILPVGLSSSIWRVSGARLSMPGSAREQTDEEVPMLWILVPRLKRKSGAGVKPQAANVQKQSR